MWKYFTLEELIRSNTAVAHGIDNMPNHEIKEALDSLVTNTLDKVREMWLKPIGVNSGYRCARLNAIVGGSPTSQHLRGEAADITTGSVEGNKRLFNAILVSGITFDQLIDESHYEWIHISCKPNTVGNRRQAMHL